MHAPTLQGRIVGQFSLRDYLGTEGFKGFVSAKSDGVTRSTCPEKMEKNPPFSCCAPRRSEEWASAFHRLGETPLTVWTLCNTVARLHGLLCLRSATHLFIMA